MKSTGVLKCAELWSVLRKGAQFQSWRAGVQDSLGSVRVFEEENHRTVLEPDPPGPQLGVPGVENERWLSPRKSPKPHVAETSAHQSRGYGF